MALTEEIKHRIREEYAESRSLYPDANGVVEKGVAGIKTNGEIAEYVACRAEKLFKVKVSKQDVLQISGVS